LGHPWANPPVAHPFFTNRRNRGLGASKEGFGKVPTELSLTRMAVSGRSEPRGEIHRTSRERNRMREKTGKRRYGRFQGGPHFFFHRRGVLIRKSLSGNGEERKGRGAPQLLQGKGDAKVLEGKGEDETYREQSPWEKSFHAGGIGQVETPRHRCEEEKGVPYRKKLGDVPLFRLDRGTSKGVWSGERGASSPCERKDAGVILFPRGLSRGDSSKL